MPRNDKLLGYWTKVADRLFKIHNSLNIQGVFQRLPLYEPPIDPALLVPAAAAGLDVSAIVAGLNQPLPLVRFQLLLSKATEICQEVKSLGANLLSAIEKQDNEALALLRARHESAILWLAEVVKYSQWQDAIKAREGLAKSLENTIQRYTYYQKLLGRSDDEIKPISSLDPLDSASLNDLKFQQTEDEMQYDEINPDISQDSTSASDGDIKTLSSHEVEELKKLNLSHDLQITASGLEALGSVLAIIPNFKVHGQPMGMGATVDFGGQHLHSLASSLAGVARCIAEEYSYESNKTAKLGSYSRREQEWTFQSNLAKGEINQILKQLRGAQIREAIAEKEYNNHKTQIQQAQDIENFLEGQQVEGYNIKTTTTDFYAWMKREVKALYSKAFQFAFEVAKKAERALQNELGDPNLNYVQFNYLDGIEGLLAGEKLMFDIKTMEMAYHDLNQREYELTKHISLLQLDPLALVQLRATGTCLITLPEELFDMDGPGHYFRRIKAVAISIPCVAGPYTSVNCTLSLHKSSIRISTDLGAGYLRKGTDDNRFNDYYGTFQSIVTSSAQSDSGLFETNLRDERYLPFEGLGIAGSQWQLTLPSDVRQFDFDTISDVILHVRYTAREGGEALRSEAIKALHDSFKKSTDTGMPLVRLFSLRHEYPSEWNRLLNTARENGDHEQVFDLSKDHFPYLFQSKKIKIIGLSLYGLPKPEVDLRSLSGLKVYQADVEVALSDSARVGRLLYLTNRGDLAITVNQNTANTKWTLQVGAGDVATTLAPLQDILLLCQFTAG